MKKFAVVLSGCGVRDGSEIHESVLCLLAIEQAKGSHACFAPDITQATVVDHYTGKPSDEKRSAIIEAARIARGKIKPLDTLKASDFDALIFPGGFGAVSTLCTYAKDTLDMQVNEDISRVIREFYENKKPIGATCIAPMILAKVFASITPVTLTLGTSQKCFNELKTLGMNPVLCTSDAFVKDDKEKVYTTPAYMEDADIKTLYVGISKMIQEIASL